MRFLMKCVRSYAPINVKPAGAGGRRGIGRDFDRSLWPGGRAFELSCCPGGRIFEFLFVPVTTNHFPGGEFQLYLTSYFRPGVGNLTAIFWEM